MLEIFLRHHRLSGEGLPVQMRVVRCRIDLTEIIEPPPWPSSTTDDPQRRSRPPRVDSADPNGSPPSRSRPVPKPTPLQPRACGAGKLNRSPVQHWWESVLPLNKSRPRRADAQKLVTTRLLDYLHDPLAQLGRLQRIHPRAQRNDNPSARWSNFSTPPVADLLRYRARGLFVSNYDVRDNIIAFRHGFWLRGVQP